MPASLQLAPRAPSAARPGPAAPNRKHRGLFVVPTDHTLAAKNPVDTLAQARRIVAQVEWEIQQRAQRERNQRLAVCAIPAAAARPSRFSELTATFRAAFGF